MNRASWFAFLDKMPAFLLAGGWAFFILILSTVGVGMNLPTTWADIIAWDKLAHAIVYFILTYWLIKGFQANKLPLGKTLLYAAVLASAYGVLMEVVQKSFFPNRYFEVLDIIANIVGVIACVLWIRRKRQ